MKPLILLLSIVLLASCGETPQAKVQKEKKQEPTYPKLTVYFDLHDSGHSSFGFTVGGDLAQGGRFSHDGETYTATFDYVESKSLTDILELTLEISGEKQTREIEFNGIDLTIHEDSSLRIWLSTQQTEHNQAGDDNSE